MQFNQSQIQDVYKFLQAGHLLAYPTEAVWGIGCDPFNETAVKQILSIKNRPMHKGMIVVTADIALIQPFLQPLAQATVAKITHSWQSQMPQATTWLLPIPAQLQTCMPAWLTGGRSTLAVRVIQHPLIAALCRHIAQNDPQNPFGFLVSTSCNPSGQTPACSYRQAHHYFADEIGYLQGETLGFNRPSQILDALTEQQVRA
jgi:L-threonylcarbamoyladenylate synthase